jgi:hypothetical protein
MGLPRLVVDVVCETGGMLGPSWSFGSLSAVFGDRSEPITSVTTMLIDSYGDRHE